MNEWKTPSTGRVALVVAQVVITGSLASSSCSDVVSSLCVLIHSTTFGYTVGYNTSRLDYYMATLVYNASTKPKMRASRCFVAYARVYEVLRRMTRVLRALLNRGPVYHATASTGSA